MSRSSLVVLLALLSSAPLPAADQPAPAAGSQPASAASAKELVNLMQGRKTFDDVFAQMDTMIDAAMKQAAADRQLTPEQQKVIDEMRAKMVALVRDTLNWDTFEPKMEEIYRKSFSQSEIDGMLRFYRSPSGKAVLAKMPVVMQNTMQVMQGEMRDMIPKMQQLMKDSTAQIHALDKPAGDGQASGGAAASNP